MHEAIDDEKVRLGQLGTEQSETFREAQERRAGEAAAQTELLEQRIEALTETAEGTITMQVEEMDRVRGAMVELSGAVALTGTSERYGNEARSQFRIANFRAGLTIVFALLAVWAAAHAATLENPTQTEFIGKLGIGLILFGISRYTAVQSSRHRRREAEARRLQLELAAFGPFIEPLEPAQQAKERVIMTRKTFGQTGADEVADDDKTGAPPLGQLLRPRQDQQQDEAA